MLISHVKRFIFTKTAKTGGTSVEAFFERYCMDERAYVQQHHRDEQISEFGIVGYRGFDRGSAVWYNHMPAYAIRDRVGAEKWGDYFKFTVIRDPFDKLVSAFSMHEHRRKYGVQSNDIEASIDVRAQLGTLPHDAAAIVIGRFREWVKSGATVSDRHAYMIDGKECLDDYIRYENLIPDIKRICARLQIDFEASQLPRFKSGYRHPGIALDQYYDEETIALVRQAYAWELDRFGYDVPRVGRTLTGG